MKLNRLLEKQLRKFMPESCRDKDEFQAFINAVNESYYAYERDIELSDRAFRMTEEEYRDINTKLKQEINIKEASINKLKEAVTTFGNNQLADYKEDNELLNIASYLKTQIAERKEIEKKLQDQKEFYERVLNQIPADIAIVDPQQRYLFVNPTAVKDAALRSWIIGKTDREYRIYKNKPLVDSEERSKHFEEVIQSRKKKEWEEKIINAEGQTEYHLRVLHPVYNERGDFDIMIIYGFNITERRKIEEQIKISEARYRSIFDNSQALICTHDLEGIVLDVNKAATKTFEYSAAELIGAPLYKLLPYDKQTEFENTYMAEIRSQGRSEGIMVAISKGGKKIYLLYQNFLVTNDSDKPYVIGFSQDITTRIEAERALKKSEEKYRSIIENMNLGLLEVDRGEHILYANHSFCDMSGYEVDELVGKNATAVFIKNEHRQTDEVIRRRQQGESDAYELKVKNKRGELKWWLISGAPVIDDNGNFNGSIGIHLDITTQKMLEQELRKAKADAEYSAHAKDVFLANMSHEIRTPMNAILGISRLLAKTGLDTQQKFYLDTVQNAANNLLVIINDLLDFSKIEAGKISLEYIGLSLENIIENAVQVLRYRAEEKGLSIGYHYTSAITPVLIGDPYRINQVLMNLLSNSIKFTEKGEIRVDCTLLSNNKKSQKILFEVTDTGVGISEEFLQHLFDKFSQEDESITRKFGGTGLGMSISKQLIELMGGEINVKSQKNVGTTISFSLTFPKGSQKDLPESHDFQIDTKILKDKRILLVEDNDMNRLLATTILTQFGADVIEAEDGNIAIEKLPLYTFDLILMDVQMPVRDGLETTRFIRSKMDKNIPIIALTANAFKQEEQRCLEAGMNDFISKPFDEDQMIRLIAQWLGRSVHLQVDTVADKEPVKLYDLTKIVSVSRGDDEFVIRMLKMFVSTMPDTLKQMKKALENRDWKTLSALAHRIKPSIQTLGITSVADAVIQIETIDPSSPNLVTAQTNYEHVQNIMIKAVRQLEAELKQML